MSVNENTHHPEHTTDENIERIGDLIRTRLLHLVIKVPSISYYLGDNARDHAGPFLVRVLDDASGAYPPHWNDDWYDPDWYVEPLPGQDVPPDAEFIVASVVSCDRSTGRWELKFEVPDDTEIYDV